MNGWFCCGGADDPRERQIIVEKNKSSRQKLATWSNERLGKCLFITDLETKQGLCLRLTVALLYFGFAAGLLAVRYYFGQHLHVVFWTGSWPQITLFVTMLATATSFFLLTRVRIIRHYRFQQLRVELRNSKVNTMLGRLRPMVLLTASFAFVAVVLGLLTVMQSYGVEFTLSHFCTESPDPRLKDMQEASDSLVKFQRQCHEKMGDKTTLAECQGFAEKFPPSSPYVAYLMRLQMVDGCTGFCQAAEPLVFKGRKHHSDDGTSCATAISRDVRFATLLVAIPCVVVGIILGIVALALYEYEYL